MKTNEKGRRRFNNIGKKALLLGLLSAGAIGYESASAYSSLAIGHASPPSVAPDTDLVLRFSISGDCQGDTRDAEVGIGYAAYVYIDSYCRPMEASASYRVGDVQRTVVAQLSPLGIGSTSRTATVVIPGAQLKPATLFSYKLYARQERGGVGASAGFYGQWEFLPIPTDPGVVGPYGSDRTSVAVWESKSIRIAGEPSPDAPSAPTLAGVQSGRYADLSWSPAPNGAPVTSYKLYRAEPSETELKPFVDLGLVTTYKAYQAVSGSPYRYAVAALNANGEGARSAVVSVISGNPPYPTDWSPGISLAAEPTGVRVSWSNVHWDSYGPPFTSVNVYRWTQGHTRSLIATIPEASTSNYLDTSVAHGETYSYEVTGSNMFGEGPPTKSSSIQADLSGAPPPPVITSPADGSTYDGGYVQVAGTATPGVRINIFVTHYIGAMNVSADGDGNWTASVYGSLNYTVFATASAANGATSARSNQIALERIDKEAPEGNFHPDGYQGSDLPGRAVFVNRVSGLAWDDVRVSKVELRYLDATGAIVKQVEPHLDRFSWSTTVRWANYPGLPAGLYIVRLQVTDWKGNTLPFDSGPVTTMVSTGPPIEPPTVPSIQPPINEFWPSGTGATAPGAGRIGASLPKGLQDADVYQVTLAPGETATFSLAYTNSGNVLASQEDIDLYLFKGTGPFRPSTQVAASTNPAGVVDAISHYSSGGGTYTLLAVGWSAGAEAVTYSATGNMTFVSEDSFFVT